MSSAEDITKMGASGRAALDAWLAMKTERDALVTSVRKYGQHLKGCQWCVFPPGDRDCTCGLHAIVGVPDFSSTEGDSEHG